MWVKVFYRKFVSTKLNVENQIDDSILEIEKIIHELETIKDKLTERKDEITNNCL